MSQTLRPRFPVTPPTVVPLSLTALWSDRVLAHFAPADSELSLLALLPLQATLSLTGADLVLVIQALGDARSALVMPIEAGWWPSLQAAFRPHVVATGQIAIGTCQVRFDWQAAGLTLILTPVTGAITRLELPDGFDLGRIGAGLAPVAAALLVAIGSVEPALAGNYVVKPGDSLSTISGRYLGSIHQWPRLFDANRRVVRHADQLQPGMVLRLPDAPKAPSSIVVRSGDTLFKLARRHLGNGARWGELWASIKGRVASPEKLPIGLTIHLPQGQATTATQPVKPALKAAQAPVVKPRPSPKASQAPVVKPASVPTAKPVVKPTPVPQATQKPVMTPTPMATLPPVVKATPTPKPVVPMATPKPVVP
ncbi:MAG: LysM peptidoglycan-binding domain-containing protein, partial [Candidatus Sericytochromatia bacterium]|nr:LysM peptidoglycan-binding domain-containing protein [Candidatus Sericytochromatia bacterium]